jgi:CRP-like cAMP-binding protein
MSNLQAVLSGHEANRILAALPAAEFDLLRNHLHEVTLPPAAPLWERGEPWEYVYFPLYGMASLVVPFSNGTEIETALIGREGALGSLIVFGFRRSLGRMIVQIESRALRIPAVRLVELLPAAKNLASALVADGERLMFQILQIGACNAVHSLEARLARWILRAADCIGSESIPLTQELMSQMLGVQRTTVNLMIRAMVNSDVLRNRRGRVEIADRPALERIACECYRSLRQNARLKADFSLGEAVHLSIESGARSSQC